MKPRDEEIDRYAASYIRNLSTLTGQISPAPWRKLKCEYDAIYREVWIWVLVLSTDEISASYEALRNNTNITEFDEEKIETNLSIFLKGPDGRYAYAVDLCGKQDILDFAFADVNMISIVHSEDANLRISQIFQ